MTTPRMVCDLGERRRRGPDGFGNHRCTSNLPIFTGAASRKKLDTGEGVFGDGQRVRVFGFLQDEAGNLGGDERIDPAARRVIPVHIPDDDDDDMADG